MSLRSFAIAALIAAPGAVTASTLEVIVVGDVIMGSEPGGRSTFEHAPGPVQTLQESRQENARASGELGGGRSQATYVFDGTQGKLALDVFTEVSGSRFVDGALRPRGTAFSMIQMFATETFFVAGTGKATVGMEFSASWDGPTFYTLGCVTYNGSRGATGVSFNSSCESFESGPNGPGPGPGFVTDKIIQATFDIDSPGGLIEFIWRIDGSAAAGEQRIGPMETAFVNALNTANIFVLTEGNVIATPQTAGFLSNPAFGRPDPDPDPEVNVIPLPASALLLLAGLAGLGALRRKRRPAD
jgi:hypothetical protein